MRIVNRPLALFMLHSGIYHFGLIGIPDVVLNSSHRTLNI